ncbi:MAG: sugar transferase [Coxiellaceae bacterium]|nr:sugar transferase [Coxiellaceae bacterium]
MLKRMVDIIGSTIILVALFPVMIVVVILTLCLDGHPVLFKQKRPGLNGKNFNLIKFRTMAHSKNKEGVLLPDRMRITKLGRFLRLTSLDELPELWNVIKGNMSLVGPRPLLVEYLERYSPEQARRHDVRPGITGWAQINGRNQLSWEQKFKLDVWYVDHQTFWLDMKILLMTLLPVLMRRGINTVDDKAMPEFGKNDGNSA